MPQYVADHSIQHPALTNYIYYLLFYFAKTHGIQSGKVSTQFFLHYSKTTRRWCTWSSYKFNKPTKTSSQVKLLKKDSKPQNDKISLDLSPNGSQLNITINGTTLNATKNLCDITIGNFSIKLNNYSNRTPYPLSTIEPSTVAVISRSLGTPLHIISIGNSPHVTAALSLSKSTINITIAHINLL